MRILESRRLPATTPVGPAECRFPQGFSACPWCYAARAVERVLVLNASYEPLNVCSLRRAHVLVWKGRAEILEASDGQLRSATTSFARPNVIRLVTYVRVPRAVTRRISRRVLFARDGWQCAYCGSSSNRLTLDHVVPRSRGGTSVWENVVASCAPCNHRKGDRLLEETTMSLRTVPRPPTPVLFIRLTADRIPETWRQYLPGIESAAAAA
jgi:5-methylcytosine-specific restriction endonuclease McrA